jgi:hypothetical protein
MLTWVDLLALFAWAGAITLGIRQGLPFALTIVVSLLLYALLAPLLPLWALPIAALILTLGVGALIQRQELPPLNPLAEAALGGLAGALWGAALALEFWVGFPAQYVVSVGAISYPSAKLPLLIQQALAQSPFALPLFGWIYHAPLHALFLPGLH